jgi:hypothetical protein
MRVDPAHLHIDRGELGHVARGEGWVGAEDRANFEHALEPGGDRHLLVELRRLGQIGLRLEIGQLEQLRAALAGRAHQLGRVDLDKAVRHPVFAHCHLCRCRHLKHQQVLWAAQIEKAPVHANVDSWQRFGGDVQRQRRPGGGQHFQRFQLDLEAAQFDIRVFDHLAGNRQGAFGAQR